MLNRLFPLRQNRMVRLYYLLTISQNGWIVAGNWIYFWTRFMSYGQLGVIDAVAFGAGLLMEIPTGAIADRWGRARTIRLALLCQTIGTFGSAFVENKEQLMCWFLFMQLGWALYSGAADALFYDTLLEAGLEAEYDRVLGTASAIGLYTSVIGMLLGGALYSIYFRLPYMAWGLLFIFGLVVSLLLREPKHTRHEQEPLASLQHIRQGISESWHSGLKRFIPVILTINGLCFTYDWGLVKPAIATEFGLFAPQQSLLYPAFTIIAALVMRHFATLRERFTDRRGLAVLLCTLGIGFAVLSLPIGYFAILPMLLISLTDELARPWFTAIVNNACPSNTRATVLSAVAFLSRLPYVLIAPIAGIVAEHGQLGWLTLAMSLVSLVVLLSWIVLRRSLGPQPA